MVHHLALLHQELDDIHGTLGHAVGELLNGDHSGMVTSRETFHAAAPPPMACFFWRSWRRRKAASERARWPPSSSSAVGNGELATAALALLGAALIFLGAALGFLGGALAVLDLAHLGFLEGALARLHLVFGQLVENHAAALIVSSGAGAGAAGFASSAAGAPQRGFRPRPVHSRALTGAAAAFSSGRVNLRLRVSTTTDLDRPWLKFCRTVPLSPPERFSVSVRLPSAPVFLSSEVVSLIP
jgi:hypothetical protein